AWDRVADLVVPRDFYRYEHREIFTAVAALAGAGKPADVITVLEQLERVGKVSDAGGMKYLNALATSVATARNAREYALIVRQRSRARAVIAICDEAASGA